MATVAKATRQRRARRQRSIRKRLAGTGQRPRLNVFRSSANIYAQVIDDVRGHTMAAASSREVNGSDKKVDRAREVGRLIAQRAQEAGIKRVVFDRGGYLYHGRIKAMAEGARAAGLEF